MTLLLWLIELVALVSGGLIFVFSLGQAWLAFNYARSKNATAEAAITAPPQWQGTLPHMLVQLPIYNERYVVERLLKCMNEFDYPRDKLHIQLLDDSNDETTETAANLIAGLKKGGLDIVHVRRPDRKGFKAGALEYGLSLNHADFVAIFDADFLPRPDFLKLVLSYFSNPKVGMVQTRWEHINANYSIVTRMMALAIDNHFSVEQGGRQAANGFINFNGTGGMWRRATIDDAGGWKSDTLTEDLDLSFRSQIKGWKFLFVENITTPSELPVEMSAVRSQQYRWTKGAAETSRKTLSDLWSSDARLAAKIVGSFHLLNSFIFLALFVFGLCSLLIAVFPVPNFYGLVIILNAMIACSIIANSFTFWTSQNKGSFSKVVLSTRDHLLTTVTFMSLATGLCAHCSIAVLQGAFGKATPFVRTPKLNVTDKTSATEAAHAYRARKVSPVVYAELALAVLFTGFIVFGLGHPVGWLAAIYLFFACGFSVVSLLSLREALA